MLRNVNPTIKVSIVELDDEGKEQGGVDFYYVQGARVILIERWEYRAGGNTYDRVEPDYVGENGVLEYLFSANYLGNGSKYTIKDVDGNYC